MKDFFNKINNFYIALILLAIIIISHIDIIVAPLGQYFSSLDLKDLNYYINIRQYGFDSILSGIFPLWTTRLFCGIPFFANSETSIFYLPNIIFFFLPVCKALNLSLIIHFFILSFGVFLWINNKIKDKFVSVIVAIISVFVSNFYLHACASHLSNITTVVWFPFLLYFYDKTFEKKSYFYIFIVSFILSLQIFAGHYQYIYYSALISFLYILVFCRNKHTIITLISSYFISVLLCLVQFLPNLDFYFEGARRLGALNYFSLHTIFSYLITSFFPTTIPYTSTWYWETSNYIGVGSIVIILLTIVHIHNKDILKYLCIVLIIYFLSFNFFSKIANMIPFWSSFRSPIKLNFFVTFFMLPILAYGIKYLLSNETKINKYFILFFLFFPLLIALFKNNIINILITFFDVLKNVKLVNFLSVIPLIFISFFALNMFFKRYFFAKVILILLLIIEPIIVMRQYSKLFIFNNDYKYEYTQVEDFNKQVRFFSNDYYNLKYNSENISGSSPDALVNYLRFMKYLEQDFNRKNILGLLRCEYIVDDKTKHVDKVGIKTLNRLNVCYDYKIETNKEKIFKLLSQKDFDIFDTVVLEKQPQYEITEKGEYNLNFLYFDENSIEFECETTKPAIILYTDNYSRGWIAYNIDNPKEKYEIIPADYIYKAISINEGKHKIRIEYNPKSFVIGLWISIISWIIYILLYIYIKFFYIMKRK